MDGSGVRSVVDLHAGLVRHGGVDFTRHTIVVRIKELTAGWLAVGGYALVNFARDDGTRRGARGESHEWSQLSFCEGDGQQEQASTGESSCHGGELKTGRVRRCCLPNLAFEGEGFVTVAAVGGRGWGGGVHDVNGTPP